jgi:hypothetical protein
MPNEPDDASGEEAAKKLISLAKAAEISGLSQGHLRLLVSGGKLWGVKIGRNWVTTETAVKAYLDTNPRPGPRPKK